MYNLPNILTISRIAVIPFIFMSIYFTSFIWAMLAGFLFVVASITDYLDGYLARAWNETSVFGRLLDPIADKLLVATALIVIVAKKYVDPQNGVETHMYSLGLTVIPVFVILCREILVSGLREFLREVNVGLPVTRLAKWKTGFQMTALSMMLFCQLSMFWGYLGEFLLWVAAVLTFITGYQYYQKSLDYVKAEERKNKEHSKKTQKTAVESEKLLTVKTDVQKVAAPAKKTSVKKASSVKKTSKVKKVSKTKKAPVKSGKNKKA